MNKNAEFKKQGDCNFCDATFEESQIYPNTAGYALIGGELICANCLLKTLTKLIERDRYTDDYVVKGYALVFEEMEGKYKTPISDIEKTRRQFNSRPGLKKKILQRDKFVCRKCGSQENLHIDHIVPISKGGTNDESNLQTLCGSCNSKKGVRSGK